MLLSNECCVRNLVRMNVMVTHLVPMNVVVSSDTHYECYLILGTSTVTWAIEVIVDRSHFFFF